jgi:hypothetical protein
VSLRDAWRPAAPAPVHVYRLRIEYPAGSFEPGWKPAAWSSPLLAKRLRRQLARQEFRWPRERLFLSRSGAWRRAFLLISYGARAEVERSAPVTWPLPEVRFDPSGIAVDQVMSHA